MANMAKLEWDEFGGVKRDNLRLIRVVVILDHPLVLSFLSSLVCGVFMVEERIKKCGNLKSCCCWQFCHGIQSLIVFFNFNTWLD